MMDVGRFLEDPKEEIWIQSYPEVFKQASEKYKKIMILIHVIAIDLLAILY